MLGAISASAGGNPDPDACLQELVTSCSVPGPQAHSAQDASHFLLSDELPGANSSHVQLCPPVGPSSTVRLAILGPSESFMTRLLSLLMCQQPQESRLGKYAKLHGILWGHEYREGTHKDKACGLCKRPLS